MRRVEVVSYTLRAYIPGFSYVRIRTLGRRRRRTYYTINEERTKAYYGFIIKTRKTNGTVYSFIFRTLYTSTETKRADMTVNATVQAV